MKKNILTILILAATLVNVTLSAVLIFVAVPAYKKTNNLLTKLNMKIELELNGETTLSSYNPDKIPASEKDASITYEEINIKLLNESGDTKAKFIQVKFGLILHNKAKDYKKVKEYITASETLVLDIVRETISNYSYLNVEENESVIKKEITERLQVEFDSECILDIAFSNFLAP